MILSPLHNGDAPRHRQYIAIDLKSFYASVECVERGLDPLDACLTVADTRRGGGTICLAVSPALKAFGTGGRPRLYELQQRVDEANVARCGSRFPVRRANSARLLGADRGVGVDFIVARPRMALYIKYSARIYGVYLRYIAPEDIHVYSIDEVFIDATPYLRTYGMTAHELAMMLIRAVLAETGITATAGVGTNLYLCKVAMDIVAKKMDPDADGVRIAELDEDGYRRMLWSHRPLTDFWRIGRGLAARLEALGITCMGELARYSLHGEERLFSLFGVNAELLIDHAWGRETAGMADIRAYRPSTRSLSSGQVLPRAYSPGEGREVIREMADVLALDLVAKGMMTRQITFYAGYQAGGHTRGSMRLNAWTASTTRLMQAVTALYDRTVDPEREVRRLGICFAGLQPEAKVTPRPQAIQLELFADEPVGRPLRHTTPAETMARERSGQQAILRIRAHYGKNAILRGLNYARCATQRERNMQIGGHQA